MTDLGELVSKQLKELGGNVSLQPLCDAMEAQAKELNQLRAERRWWKQWLIDRIKGLKEWLYEWP